jgi:citrate synthase
MAKTASRQDDEAVIDAKAALAMLGVKPQTFYAYVSRGLIRPAPGDDPKRRMYYRRDVEAATDKGRSDRAISSSAERSLRWGGAAVMHTAITLIGPGGPVYRGHPAIGLARAGRTFEECAELLWNGVLPEAPPLWPLPRIPPAFAAFAPAICAVARRNTSRQLLALTAEAYIAATGRIVRRESGTQEHSARELIQVMACAFGLLRVRPRLVPATRVEPVASVIARSIGIACSGTTIAALDACLVVAADHELTPSTFVARIAASSGADVMSCIGSALGAFEGQQNGIGCDECEQALWQASSTRAYVALLAKSLAQKKQLAGFNHFAYPQGDLRGDYLVQLAAENGSNRPRTKIVLARIAAARKELGATPSVVGGLVAAGALMALSRSAGWVAHACEQRLTGFAVRPRARYIGSPGPHA